MFFELKSPIITILEEEGFALGFGEGWHRKRLISYLYCSHLLSFT